MGFVSEGALAVFAALCETGGATATLGVVGDVASTVGDLTDVPATSAAEADSLRAGADTAPCPFARLIFFVSAIFVAIFASPALTVRGDAAAVDLSIFGVLIDSRFADFGDGAAEVSALPTFEDLACFAAPALRLADLAFVNVFAGRFALDLDRFEPVCSEAFDTFFVTFLRAAIGKVSRNARRQCPPARENDELRVGCPPAAIYDVT